MHAAFCTKPYALKSLHIRTIEQIKSELMAANRLLLGNETSDDYEYDEAVVDSVLTEQLRNTTIKVLAKKVFPFICFRDLEDGQQRLTGFVGDVWHTLEEHLGFKTELIVDVKNAKEWDVLLNPRELSLKRLVRYSYTFPIAKIWYHLFAKLKPYGGSSVVYFHLFDRRLWAVFILASLVLSVSLWAAWKVRRKVLKAGRHMSRTEFQTDINYSTCVLSVLGCMINQGSQFKTEKCTSIRIITLMCIILGLIVTTSFSALLISKLATVGSFSGEDVSLKSVAESPQGRTLCVATQGYAYRRITANHEPHYMKKSTLKINDFPCTPGSHDLVPSQDYCADNTVVMETIYNVGHAMSANPVLNSDSCNIYFYREKYFTSHLILVVRKDFPYLRIINKYLLRMEESGLTKKLTEAWQSSPTKQRDSNEQDSQDELKVNFYHIKPVISVYLGSVVVSLLLLGLERLYKRLGK